MNDATPADPAKDPASPRPVSPLLQGGTKGGEFAPDGEPRKTLVGCIPGDQDAPDPSSPRPVSPLAKGGLRGVNSASDAALESLPDFAERLTGIKLLPYQREILDRIGKRDFGRSPLFSTFRRVGMTELQTRILATYRGKYARWVIVDDLDATGRQPNPWPLILPDYEFTGERLRFDKDDVYARYVGMFELPPAYLNDPIMLPPDPQPEGESNP